MEIDIFPFLCYNVNTYIKLLIYIKLTRKERFADMKKLLCILLCLPLLLIGCKKTEKNPAGGHAATGEDTPYKIGIITGSAVYNEAVFAAERLAEKYNFITTAMYADNLSSENTISVCTKMAEDPKVRAIVFVRAIAGIDAAIDAVRATRPDMLFIVGADTEDAAFVSQKADISMAQDIYGMGREMIDQAYRMGARHFIHYTFARHLLSEPVLRRREAMVARCKELGIEFMDVTTPDPEDAAGGGAEARIFIEEDVPEQVGNFGPSTAFFCTDCTIHTQLIKTVMECGAIYPQQCCPSPFHGLPNVFGIDVGSYHDPDGVLRQIAQGVADYGATGRVSTWPISSDTLMVEAGVQYAQDYCEGRVTEKANKAHMQAIFDSLTGGRCHIGDNGNGNCFLFICDYYML